MTEREDALEFMYQYGILLGIGESHGIDSDQYYDRLDLIILLPFFEKYPDLMEAKQKAESILGTQHARNIAIKSGSTYAFNCR